MHKTLDRLEVITFSDGDSVWIKHHRNEVVTHKMDLDTDEVRDLYYLLGLVLEEKQKKDGRREQAKRR